MNKLILSLAAVAHLLPHPFGVSSVGATALYAGAYGNRKYFWLIPLAVLLLGNIVTGFYDITVVLFVYAGFALSALVGRLALAHKRNPRRYALGIVLGAVVFYLVSNFSIWLVGMYPPTPAGLVQCYVNGLPYLGTAIVADTVYTVLLFSLHARLERPQPRMAAA